jgi:hypothetical protein
MTTATEKKVTAHKPCSHPVEMQRRRMAGDALAGRCFVVPLDEPRKGVSWQYQGWIAGQVEPGTYLVFLFSCFDGRSNRGELVTLDQMRSWIFFEDDETLRFEIEEGSLRNERDGPGRKIERHFAPAPNGAP